MYGLDHVRRAIRHYLEKDEDLRENPEDPARLVRSVSAAFTLAKASVGAARDLRDSVLRLPAAEPGRPSPHHRHFEAVWSFLSALWELIDFCELEQEVASSDVDDPVWFFGRALDQHLGGNGGEALRIMDESGLGRAAADPWVATLRAECHAALGDFEEALASWEQATDLDPLQVGAHVSAAGELESLGRGEQARKHWQAVYRIVPRDDPLAAEARRHLRRLRPPSASEAVAASDPVRERSGARLPRWGPSWVPAWPGRGRGSGGETGSDPPRADGGAPDVADDPSAAEAGVRAMSSGLDNRPTFAGRAARSLLRAGRFDSMLGLSGTPDGELRVCVAGADLLDDGLLLSSNAVYLAGGRILGVGTRPEDFSGDNPDLVVLASGISLERCAEFAEWAASGLPRARLGQVRFLYNGPEMFHDDLRLVFDEWPLEVVPDIRPPVREEEEEIEEEWAAADTTEATIAAVEAMIRERAGDGVTKRVALAHGCAAMAPVLDWLDGTERRHAGRRPPLDLLAVTAEPWGVETVAVKDGRAAGQSFGMEGADRSRLLEEVFEELPGVLPPGDVALLMGRIIGQTGPPQVTEGEEGFTASCLVAGILSRAATVLRPEMRAGFSGGLRSSHLLVGGSLLTRLPGPEYGLMAVVDGCQPVGVTRVLLDPHGIAASLGEGLVRKTLRPEDPSWSDGTAALLAGSCLCVAPLVQPVKWGRPGRRRVLEVSVKGAWRDGERRWELCRGELIWVPLPAGRRIELVVRPAPVYSVGRGRGGEWRGDFVAGGLGLLLDGRGRPFRLPGDAGGRDTLRAAWASQLIGQPARVAGSPA